MGAASRRQHSPRGSRRRDERPATWGGKGLGREGDYRVAGLRQWFYIHYSWMTSDDRSARGVDTNTKVGYSLFVGVCRAPSSREEPRVGQYTAVEAVRCSHSPCLVSHTPQSQGVWLAKHSDPAPRRAANLSPAHGCFDRLH